MLFPRHNLDFTAIDSYLTTREIERLLDFKEKELNTGFNKALGSIYYCLSFKHYIVSDLIHRAKFSGELAICDDLVKILQLVFDTGLLAKPDYFTFVPPDPARYSKRNYHIPKILTLKLAAQTRVKVGNFFEKKYTTFAQSSLAKEDRLGNLRGAFKLTDNLPDLENKFIYIIDDVVTTGSTLNELATLLTDQRKNLKIKALTLAG